MERQGSRTTNCKDCGALKLRISQLEEENSQLKREKLQLEDELRSSIKKHVFLLRCASGIMGRQSRLIASFKRQIAEKQKKNSDSVKRCTNNTDTKHAHQSDAATENQAEVNLTVSKKSAVVVDKNKNKQPSSSKQRDEQSPPRRRFRAGTPEGFWDVDIPETPQSQRHEREERKRVATQQDGRTGVERNIKTRKQRT